MIASLLAESRYKKAHEVSFILGQRVLLKFGQEWNEIKNEVLAIEEWEDLKDVCLAGNEKVQLETKGFVVGTYESGDQNWKFAFTEKKECFRAHLSLVKKAEETLSQIENPLFWDAAKKEKGLFIVGGERRQGKTALIQEIVMNIQKSKLSLTAVHSTVQNQNWPAMDSVVQLGMDTVDFDINHIMYEGIERLVVDTNSIKNWKKWIEIAEQGQCVIVSLSSNSIKTILNKLASDLDLNNSQRLVNVLNGIVVQKLIGQNYHPCSEILIFSETQKNIMSDHLRDNSVAQINLQSVFKDFYQSLNQAIVQKLIRRKIDVQAAFEGSDDPESLDATLKKMGL